MKFSKTNYILSFFILGSVLVTSCKKEFEKLVIEDTDLSDKALLKVYNSALNTNRNFVYIDDVPATGSILAYGGLFPSTGYAATVEPGSRAVTIKDTLKTTTQNTITFTHNFEAGKNYTLFTYDTVNAVKYKIVNDIIEVPADTTARLRFVNLVYSSTPLPNVDLYSVRRAANLFTNIALAQVTDFIPFPSNTTDTIYVRATGTTTNLTPIGTVRLTEKRSFTLVYRGRYGTTTPSTAPLLRTLSGFASY
jgi:hypothetical protein